MTFFDLPELPSDIIPPVEIDADDPLLGAFTLQHDLRERFLHALEEIAALRPTSKGVRGAIAIAMEAIGDEQIEAWMADGRPLPWIDNEYGQEAAIIDRIAQSFASGGIL